ncbi:MAG: hypothetical protein IT539_13490 [Bradyrhizobiaceae bacterium]|nr:hypothetical protein [Bradyrhizobiaceae bacterium]
MRIESNCSGTSERRLWPVILIVAAIGGCAGDGGFGTPPPAAGPVPPAVPASAIAGRWGLAAYHREEDRERTVVTARGLCSQPYTIAIGPNGGVVMHLADQPQMQELAVKGATGGRTFIGPPGDPGGPEDREIIQADGQTIIMRWLDPEVASRYGTSVFARCPDAPATAARQPASRPAPARKGQ